RVLIELTRIPWFPVENDLVLWPFALGFLPAAYHGELPMNEVVKGILFYLLLSTLMHCAACVINDMLDCDFDRKLVQRTKDQPFASGVVTKKEASILLAVLIAA
ncbi:hypothetical protein K503DRAFT_655932, partial [Rhizopogon vinicolor AM-OR11-026]